MVVPVRNGMPWVEHQLRALTAQQIEVDWEVVVAENGSNDGTRSCVQRWSERCPRIHLVDASAGRGAGAARNIGVRAARGSLVAFCDADDVVRPGWLASMAAALADADLVAGVFDFSALDGIPTSIPVPAATRQLGFLPFALGANWPSAGTSSRQCRASTKNSRQRRTSTCVGGYNWRGIGSP